MKNRFLKFEELKARRLLAGHSAAYEIVVESEPNNQRTQADTAEVSAGETVGLVGEISSRRDRDYSR